MARICRRYGPTRQPGRRVGPYWFQEFSDLEQVATDIDGWHSDRIPGPLQSEPYMLRQFSIGATMHDVNDLVLQRTRRKEIFDKPRPPSYRVILGEGALLRMPGGTNAMIALDQVEYLLTLVRKYARVQIQMLRFDAKIACPPDDFTVMRFPGEASPKAFVEHVAGILSLVDDRSLQLFADAWHDLVSAAMSRHETIEFLENRAEELHRR